MRLCQFLFAEKSMSKGLWYNAEMFYYSLLWLSADKNGIHDKMSFGVIDSSLRVTIPFSIFLTKRSCLCLEWQESIRRYPKHSKESAAMMRKAVRRHPSHRFFTLCHCSVFYFSHKASCLRSEWQRTASVILNECEGSMTVVREMERASWEVMSGIESLLLIT